MGTPKYVRIHVFNIQYYTRVTLDMTKHVCKRKEIDCEGNIEVLYLNVLNATNFYPVLTKNIKSHIDCLYKA